MVELTWLIGLRWIAVFSQCALVLMGKYLVILTLPLPPLLVTIGVVALSNLALHFVRETWGSRLLGAVILFDICALTTLLYFSGGASNPFSLFYIVHVALGAFLLGERWTWILAALAILLYGLLFAYHFEIPELSSHEHHSSSAFSLHLHGMWLAFALVSATLSFFFTRLLRAINIRDEKLVQASSLRLRQERISSVTALAANAAHELNNPLGTIALAAEEIANALTSSSSLESVNDDANLIRAEVKRCSNILDRLRASAADPSAELPQEIKTENLIRAIKERVNIAEAERIVLSPASHGLTIHAPLRPLIEALLALVRNALAADINKNVIIQCERNSMDQQIKVIDQGPGIPSCLQSRLGEPFFTTRPNGSGMGLGVFLAKRFTEAMNGVLVFSSKENEGTTVAIGIPVK